MKLFPYLKHFSLHWILLVGLTFFSFSSWSFALDAIGQVVWVRGSVAAIDSSGHARALQRRAPIYEQDTIETKSGTAQIVFTDNSIVALRSGTTFRVDQYKFNPSSPDSSKYVAGLAKGGFRTITGLISKSNPEGYEVNTPVATIGVRGTDYSIFYTSSHGLSVKLDRGVITVSNDAGKVELNVARNRVYAEIAGLHVSPVITHSPSASFSSQPSLTHAVMMPMDGGGSGTPPSAGASSDAGSTTYAAPSGPSRQVSEFCVE